jgi:hypothetical protein
MGAGDEPFALFCNRPVNEYPVQSVSDLTGSNQSRTPAMKRGGRSGRRRPIHWQRDWGSFRLGPGESYSDVILRLIEIEAKPRQAPDPR